MCPNMTYSVCAYRAKIKLPGPQHWPAGWSRSFRVIILWACMPLSLLRLNLIYISKSSLFFRFFFFFIFSLLQIFIHWTVRHRTRIYATHFNTQKTCAFEPWKYWQRAKRQPNNASIDDGWQNCGWLSTCRIPCNTDEPNTTHTHTHMRFAWRVVRAMGNGHCKWCNPICRYSYVSVASCQNVTEHWITCAFVHLSSCLLIFLRSSNNAAPVQLITDSSFVKHVYKMYIIWCVLNPKMH